MPPCKVWTEQLPCHGQNRFCKKVPADTYWYTVRAPGGPLQHKSPSAVQILFGSPIRPGHLLFPNHKKGQPLWCTQDVTQLRSRTQQEGLRLGCEDHFIALCVAAQVKHVQSTAMRQDHFHSSQLRLSLACQIRKAAYKLASAACCEAAAQCCRVPAEPMRRPTAAANMNNMPACTAVKLPHMCKVYQTKMC